MSAVPPPQDSSLISLPDNLPSLDASLEFQGRQIYQDNPHFRAFANVLNHPEFRSFFETHFETWDDCRLSLMILKVFTELRKRCAKETGKEPTPFELVAMVHTVLNETDSRRFICQTVSEQLPVQTLKQLEDDLPSVDTLELRPYSFCHPHGKGRGFDCVFPDGSHLTLSLWGILCEGITNRRFRLELSDIEDDRYRKIRSLLEMRLRKALNDDSVHLSNHVSVKREKTDLSPAEDQFMEQCIKLRLTRLVHNEGKVWTVLWCRS